MDTKDIFTLVVALYGAGLSTYVAIAQRRDKWPRVEAKLAYGFLTHAAGLSDTQILLSAANVGHTSVTLSSGGLLLADGSQVLTLSHNTSERLPQQLEPGKSLTMWFELRPLAAELASRGRSGKIKVRAKFIDQTSREYLSKPMEIDVSEWAS